jgi:hypothetical protein
MTGKGNGTAMVRTFGRIIKSEDVELQGQFRLEVPQGELAGAAPRQQGTGSAPTQARILENHPQYVVIEVTCSCGTRLVLKCDYAGAATPDNSQTRQGADAAPKRTT